MAVIKSLFSVMPIALLTSGTINGSVSSGNIGKHDKWLLCAEIYCAHSQVFRCALEVISNAHAAIEITKA